MILYHHLTEGRFLLRRNRFIADCQVDGQRIACHVKNTGRLRELLLPGATVWLEASDNPARKTRFDLVAVAHGGRVVNIDSQAPNAVFAEWARAGGYLPGLTALTAEVRRGESRFDFTYRRGDTEGFAEIKGVTLFDERGVAYFPDAPTQRGVKHLTGLADIARGGGEAGVCFLLMREDALALRPNDATHPAFGQALREARSAGVLTTAVCCRVTPDSVTALRTVPVLVSPDETIREGDYSP